MNPVLDLTNVARKVAALGDRELAARIQRAATVAKKRVAAADDIALDSWSEFNTWFLKNRSQGLEFVFEDLYGADSKEVQQVRQLIEGYDLIERKTHELYEVLKNEEPAPADQADEQEASPEDDVEATEAAEEESLSDVVDDVADETPAEEPATDEAVEADETSEPEATTDEVTSEEAAAKEEAATEEATEEPSEEAAAAEEALSPAKAEASTKPPKTTEAKMITRLQKLLTKAKVATTNIAFAGNNSYRIQFPDHGGREAAQAFFAKTGMATAIVDHPVKVFLSVTP